jgi:Icc-related predicted phosphoesterase
MLPVNELPTMTLPNPHVAVRKAVISSNNLINGAVTMCPLRILGLADLHDRAEMLDFLMVEIDNDIDIIAFCGDLHSASGPAHARRVAEALAKLGPPVLIVPGNMDHRDFAPDVWRAAGLMMVHDTSFKLEDCGFIGFGGMVPHNPNKIGDPARYYHSDKEIYESLARSHRNIADSKWRIVITHQPPRGARDIIYSGESTGCAGLRRFVDDFQPDLLMCGHIHEDRGEAHIGKTKVINVGELRRSYAALVEIDEKIRVKWIEP